VAAEIVGIKLTRTEMEQQQRIIKVDAPKQPAPSNSSNNNQLAAPKPKSSMCNVM
jgi:hypothetical protein